MWPWYRHSHHVIWHAQQLRVVPLRRRPIPTRLEKEDEEQEQLRHFSRRKRYFQRIRKLFWQGWGIYIQPPPGLNLKIDRMFDIFEYTYLSCDQTLVKASHQVDESVRLHEVTSTSTVSHELHFCTLTAVLKFCGLRVLVLRQRNSSNTRCMCEWVSLLILPRSVTTHVWSPQWTRLFKNLWNVIDVGVVEGFSTNPLQIMCVQIACKKECAGYGI